MAAADSSALLPFDRPGRLRCDVVDDAVDAADLADDSAGDGAEDFIRQRRPVGCHAVFAFDGADGAGVSVGALVAHNANRLDGKQHGKALPDLAVEPGTLDFVDADGVGFLQNRDALRCDFAEDADREAGAGEGLALEDFFGHLQVAADAADFVLEEVAERLDEFELHVRGQAADVVVALDDVRRPVDTGRFNDVGIERALHQPRYFFANFPGACGSRFFSFEDSLGFGDRDRDDFVAYGLALLLGIGVAGEFREEARARIDRDDVEAEAFAHGGLDFGELVLAQDAVVDEDAGEAVTYRSSHEDCGDA